MWVVLLRGILLFMSQNVIVEFRQSCLGKMYPEQIHVLIRFVLFRFARWIIVEPGLHGAELWSDIGLTSRWDQTLFYWT